MVLTDIVVVCPFNHITEEQGLHCAGQLLIDIEGNKGSIWHSVLTAAIGYPYKVNNSRSVCNRPLLMQCDVIYGPAGVTI